MIEAETKEEQDTLDAEDQDEFKNEAIRAMLSIGLPEDEAEIQFEDMFGY
jgi:hypothetical protein